MNWINNLGNLNESQKFKRTLINNKILVLILVSLLLTKRLITCEKTGVTDFLAYLSATSIKYIAFSSFREIIVVKVVIVNKLQLLVGKISDNFESTKANKIFLRARSKSFRNIDTLLLKYSNSPKTKHIRRVSLYDINMKKIIRNKKRRGTEIKFDRKKVVIDKVVIKDETKDRNKKKKATKAEIKQHLIEKRNEINEIKRLILLNDIGKNNWLLDVVKRGFAFINDKSNKDLIKNKINKKIEEKKIVKIDENETESNKVLIIKEKIRNLIENKNIFELCNRDNNNLFKNKKNIFKNLNNGLNEFRFYNKANDNSIEKYKYYERKVIPGLFDNKVNKRNFVK